MRVGLDLLFLIPGETGGREAYVRELVPAMLKRAPDLEIVAFTNRDTGPELAAELGPGVRAVSIPVSARSRAQWAFGELCLLPLAARREAIELLHSPANFAPAFGPFKRVVTIHDLQYQVLPGLLSPTARLGTGALVSLAAKRADRMIAVSASGRDEIVAGLGVSPESIDVVHNGVRPPSPPASADVLRARLRLEVEHVVLTVATNLPHKNLSILFEALANVPLGERPILVLAGHETDAPDLAATAAAMGVSDHVRLLGACSSAELEQLYDVASCLLLPTLHEGFGLPIVEAMARSVPVVCSDIASLREIGGDAALYFDPRSSADIAQRLSTLLGDPALADRLRGGGLARASTFSWEAAAAGTIASYVRALANDEAPAAMVERRIDS